MLALTIFREELNMKMLMLFTALIFIKLFHWLAAMRVEAIARSEVMARWQHIRLVALLAFLAAIDWAFVVSIAVVLLRARAASVLLLFGFEFLILAVSLASIFIKYVMLQLDARWEARGQHWNNKNTWSAKAEMHRQAVETARARSARCCLFCLCRMFYLDLCGDLLRLCLYLLFFLIICNFYGLPLHLIRELGITFFTLRERISKFLHYRRITANMQTRFPDATAAEIEAGDKTCIVCREDMEVPHAKKSEQARTGQARHARLLRQMRQQLTQSAVCALH